MMARLRRPPRGVPLEVVASIAVLAVLILSGLAPFATGSGIPSAASSGEPSVQRSAPSTPAASVVQGPRPALTSLSAGQVVATDLVNLNASIPGNVAYRTEDWVVGSPTIVPIGGNQANREVWYPTYPRHVSPYPQPSTAPALVFNESTGSFTGIVPSLTNSSALFYDSVNRLIYATQPLTNTLVVFDPSLQRVAASPIPVGSDPSAVVYNSANGTLFVANQGSNNVSVVNTISNEVVESGIAVGHNPQSLVYDKYDGTVFVSNGNSSYLTAINASTYATQQVFLTGPAYSVAYSNLTGNLLVTIPTHMHGALINATTFGTITGPSFGVGASAVATCWDGQGFAVAVGLSDSVSVYSATTGNLMNGSFPTGLDPTGIILDPVNSLALIWDAGSRSLTGISLPVGGANPFGTGPSIRPVPVALAYSGSMDRVYVANLLDGSVTVLNATTLHNAGDFPTPINGSSLTGPPLSLAIDDANHTLYAAGYGGVSAIDTLTNHELRSNASFPGDNLALTLDLGQGKLWVINNESGLYSLYLSNLTRANLVGIAKGNSTDSSIALDPINHELYVVDHLNDSVAVVNTSTGAIMASALDPGRNATSAVYDAADNSVYVLGAEVTIIDPSTNTVLSSPIVIPQHYASWGILYDPSREFVDTLTSYGLPALSGNLTAIDGSSIAASYDPSVSIPVGQLPYSGIPVDLPGTAPNGASEIWVANPESGTLSVIASPPSVNSFAASPSQADVGQTVHFLLSYAGGAGVDSITYNLSGDGGLSCPSASGALLNCTPSQTGTYSVGVSVTDQLGEVATASASVSISPGLSVIATVNGGNSELTVDSGQKVVLNATGVGGTLPYTYLWTKSTGPGLIQDPNASDTVATLDVTTDIIVTVTDADLVSTSWSDLIIVDPLPTSAVAASPSNVTDVGRVISFFASVEGGSGILASGWSSTGSGTSSSGPESLLESWSTPGTYNVTFFSEDHAFEWANSTIQVHVNPALTLSATWSYNGSTSTPPRVAETVQFVVTVSGGTGPYDVLWNFGDNSGWIGASAQHPYATAGNYTVDVEVIDALGATANSSLPLMVLALVKAPAPPSTSSSSTSGLWTGLLLGLIAGAAIAACVVYAADRSRRRSRPPPASPYVPPASPPVHPWQED
jgi:YVTN family beta-propeller protein